MKFRSDDQRRAVFSALARRTLCSQDGCNDFAKKKFYHGSAGFRGRVIMADGLIPPTLQEKNPHAGVDEMRGPEFDEYVFLTTDKDIAKMHANNRVRHWGDTEYGPIVYEAELDESEVVPDTFDPVRYPDSFKYKGVIPSNKLKRIKLSKDPKYSVSDASVRYLFLRALENNNINPNSVPNDVVDIFVESIQDDYDGEGGDINLLEDADSQVSQLLNIWDNVRNGATEHYSNRKLIDKLVGVELKPLVGKDLDFVTEDEFKSVERPSSKISFNPLEMQKLEEKAIANAVEKDGLSKWASMLFDSSNKEKGYDGGDFELK